MADRIGGQFAPESLSETATEIFSYEGLTKDFTKEKNF